MKFNLLPKRKLGIIFIVISTILFPLTSSFFIVSMNSYGLIKKWMSYILLFITVFTFISFFLGIYFLKTANEEKKFKKRYKILYFTFIILYTFVGYAVVGKLYFDSKFKDWLVTSAMTSMRHHHYATWFYDDYTISEVMANNDVIESGENTNANLIDFRELNFNKKTYENKFEEQIFTKDKGNDIYKIINIDQKGNSSSRIIGKLAVIYDPSKVRLGVSKGMGSDLSRNYGQFVYEITKRYDALVGINAGGFMDPGWNSWGGVPDGYVFSGGKPVLNNRCIVYCNQIVGFDKNNRLILSRMGYNQAINAGIRDAVNWGPFLIVNGKKSFIKGNGGWGTANRTAIGQRADGIVLFLVMDGRSSKTAGADMVDLTEIMSNYGAINAANMDGGTSSSMVENHKIITNPVNGSGKPKTRPVPNAWIVTK